MKLLRNVYTEIYWWGYWFFHITLIQFEAVGWWWESRGKKEA